jgi:isopenicillin N synthase-like dioxygenase
MRREYPSTVNARMEDTIRPFIQKSLDVNYTLMDVFDEKLGLPTGSLRMRHPIEEFSGSESRCIKNPASPHNPTKVAIGAHTDFGSLVSHQ